MEDLHCGPKSSSANATIRVGTVAEDDGLLFQSRLRRGDVIAQPGGTFEVELGRRRVHLLLEFAGEPIGLSR